MSLTINSYISSTKDGLKPKFKPDLSYDFKEIPKDSVEISSKKSKKKFANLVAFTGIAVGVATIAFRLYKNKVSKVVKIPEWVDFQRAKTLKEAIKYGRETFGIKNYIGFEEKDLDVVNWINEGIANIANAYKGQEFRVPKGIAYQELDKKSTLAGIVIDEESEFFEYCAFNKAIFGDIDNKLKEKIQKAIDDKLLISDSGLQLNILKPNDRFKQLLKMYFDSKLTSFNDKVELYRYIMEAYDVANDIVSNQHNLLANINVGKTSPFKTIFHEFGHLQDMVQRPMAKGNYKDTKKYPKELKQWLEDKKKIRIAQSVSSYATEGPGEFIAEVYSKLLCGAEIKKEALELYKEMNGPSIPGII